MGDACGCAVLGELSFVVEWRLAPALDEIVDTPMGVKTVKKCLRAARRSIPVQFKCVIPRRQDSGGYVGAAHRENQGEAAFVLGDNGLKGFQRAFKIS